MRAHASIHDESSKCHAGVKWRASDASWSADGEEFEKIEEDSLPWPIARGMREDLAHLIISAKINSSGELASS